MARMDKKVVTMYVDELKSCGEIAKRYRVSHTGVWKYLNRQGVDTRKRRLSVKCAQCGGEVKRGKKRIKTTRHPFCSPACYYAYIHNPAYRESKKGQRRAHTVMRRFGKEVKAPPLPIPPMQETTTKMRLDGGIIELYLDHRILMTCAEIAVRYDVSRSGVRRHLKHQGVNVSKEKIEVKCAYCGATLHRDRADVRKTRDQFCDQEHYRAFIRSPEYQKARIAQLMAKKVYARLGHSKPQCIMFLDNDIHNLNPSNLLGFRSRRDMAMYDIGEEVEAFLCASGTWEPIQKGSL